MGAAREHACRQDCETARGITQLGGGEAIAREREAIFQRRSRKTIPVVVMLKVPRLDSAPGICVME